MRDTVLPKTRKTVEYDGNSVLIYFVVDTSSVEKNQIAVVADAAKLKDVNGNYLLNGNLNLTAGEEGDSFIEYIGVAKNKDGTSTTPLSGDDEVFDPSFGNFLEIFTPAYWEGPYIDDGKLVVKTGVVSYTDASDDTIKYFDGLASTLNSIFSLEVAQPGENKFSKDTAMSFTYNESVHRYVAESGVLAPGSSYRLVTGNAIATETDQSLIKFGHPTVWCNKDYDEEGNYYGPVTTYGSAETVTFFTEEPDYIIGDSEFTPGYYDYIDEAQRACVDVSKNEQGGYTVTLKEVNDTQLKFASYADFIVINSKTHAKIPAKVTKINDTKVKIVLNNRYYDADDGVKIYAGYGVTLQENPVNDKQTHFGMYKNIGDGEHSGYVCIAGFGSKT